MNIAVLVKQVPDVETLTLRPDGRLQRDRVDLEMNAYCRRAVSKGVELAADHGGRCTVFTLGPRAAEDVLREAVAWGADEGVLISDPAFAGSDTLATARALAAALRLRGPFDLVLAGRNSIDADTGQVGPQVAELLGLPFAAGARELTLKDDSAQLTCELDDGFRTCRVRLPAVLSVAERLTRPCKVPPPVRADVDAGRLAALTAADLGKGPWGPDASPTAVGEVRTMEISRRRVILSGDPADQAAQAARLLGTWDTSKGSAHPRTGPDVPPAPAGVPGRGPAPAGPGMVVIIEPGRPRAARELLGEAARLTAGLGGAVTAFGPAPLDLPSLAAWGADTAVEVVGDLVEEDIAAAAAAWCAQRRPWAGLAPGTLWGREVAGRMAARLNAGLTGDAIGFELTADSRLLSWKPAFGGRTVAAITATSDLQLATVRPGVLLPGAPRETTGEIPLSRLAPRPRGRVEVTGQDRDDEAGALLTAQVVVSVGSGVPPGDYPLIEPLARRLGAEFAASRKVTDRGWQPRARQVGVTGQNIQPSLYVAIAISGKFNHMAGARGAGTILAINNDPAAPVFEWADIGIVADWRRAVPPLIRALSRD